MEQPKTSTREAQTDPEQMMRNRLALLERTQRVFHERKAAKDEHDTNAAVRREERKQKYTSSNPEIVAQAMAEDAQNKLRRNNITPVLDSVELVLDIFEKTPVDATLKSKVETLAEPLPKIHDFVASLAYDDIPFEQKVALAEEIDRRVQAIIDAIKQQP